MYSVEAQNISFQYKGGIWGVRDFSIQAHAGDFCLIRGMSGSGKSTVVRCLSGIIPHLYKGLLKGKVSINGMCTTENPMWKITRQVGVVLQNPLTQFLTDTVKNEILFSLEKTALDKKTVLSRFNEAVEFFELSALLWQDPHLLSGGEQQRVILACHFARQPEILIMDEPFAMLDKTIAPKILANLQSFTNHQGKTAIIFEHRHTLFDAIACKNFSLKSLQSEKCPPLSDVSFLKKSPSFQINLQNVGVSIHEKKILSTISLSFTNGEIVALLGPNGAGKTTLLRTLAGFQPYQGRIEVNENFSTSSAPDLGIVFQNPDTQLFNPTVKEELLFGTKNLKEKTYREVLSFLGLDAYASTSPLLLSEGEKKRLSLGIILLRQPRHGFMLDEPTFGLDAYFKEFCGQVLRLLAGKGYVCLVSTHDIAWAQKYASRFLVIKKGALVYDGPQGENAW